MNKYLTDLNGKNILITGASRGIGKECAIAANRLGANVCLVARNMEKIKKTLDIIEKEKSCYYAVDVTDYLQVEDVVNVFVEKFGRIDGFIHSAGFEESVPLQVISSENYEKLFATNVIAGFEFAKVISKKRFLNPNGASFVFIASVMGIVGQAAKIGYCASKGALIAGARAMAVELAKKKIRVNCVSPGMVETEIAENIFKMISEEQKRAVVLGHPLGIGSPEDVAGLCSFLLSDQAKWITGTNIIIDGGYSAV
ncbi:MAG: SDR family oxidoreductase [Candidatus Omnitrophota bacterium]|nr:SDR family oxidoreductase [Candidatus Omnitrophota bacterium]